MILRHRPTAHALSCALLLLSLAAVRVSADDDFDCHVTIGDYKYDLTKLEGVQTASQDRDSPPTKYRDTVTFNVCGELPRSSEPENEQCPEGTRACLTKTNLKDGESERVTEVVQLATSTADSISYEALASPNKGISLTFKGADYPDPYTKEPTAQSFNVRVFCDTETHDPVFKSYDGSALWIEWHATAGCSMASPGPGDPPVLNPEPGNDEEGEETSVGSGLGYFFLLLLIAFLVYFGLGAYYNYSTYGATGLDLIPHRDFWREVPYMLRDVVSHLCSTVRPRQSGRGGYIAV